MSNPAEILVCQPIIYLPPQSRLGAQTNGSRTRRAVFFDRDGTIIEDIGYLTSVADIKLLEGAKESIRLLQQQFLIIIVTNQSAVGQGLIDEDDLLRIHQSLVDHLLAEETYIDAIYSCPHHPESARQPYRIWCNGRKPEPGMLQKAAHQFDIQLDQSYLIGDKSSDILAGQRAGVSTTILVNSPKTGSTILPEVKPTLLAKNIYEATTQLMAIKRLSV